MNKYQRFGSNCNYSSFICNKYECSKQDVKCKARILITADVKARELQIGENTTTNFESER